METGSLLRGIPKVDDVLAESAHSSLCANAPRGLVVEAIRLALDDIRSDARAGALDAIPPLAGIVQAVEERVRRGLTPNLRRVINATGIALHTNFGRAPLCASAIDAVCEVAGGYSTLEYDVERGSRGSRHSHVDGLLTKLTGAEAALVVNNNAAAVLLMLAALTRGKDVILSRGELVEIGGQFRVPDIMRESGSNLIEVGTTNKTHLSDYAAAIDPDQTGAILKVHTSNFKIIGFYEEVGADALAALAHAHGIPMLYDLGSGALASIPGLETTGEPTVASAMADGADLICFSGDKLLGGPQAGIVIGRASLVEAMKAHPLARAVRIDKMTLAALEATLRRYLEPETVCATIPLLGMLGAQESDLDDKAHRLLACIRDRLPELDARVVVSEGQVGGGSMPGETLRSRAVALQCPGQSLDALDAWMRAAPVPIVGCIRKEQYTLDVRTIAEADFDAIADRLCAWNANGKRGEVRGQ